MKSNPKVLMLAGATASGKTGLAVGLAQRFGVEIISADSMQVYRGMEIGTAQPTAAEREQARFHVCGELDPADPFSVAKFMELCDRAHADIISRGRLPLYVGGTGLYLRALRWGLFEQQAADPEVRLGLMRELEAVGPGELHRRLATVDPAGAAHIAAADAVRIVRALEVHAVTGRPLSELQRQWERPRPRFAHTLAVIVLPREEQRRRITLRTRQMLEGGWLEEVRELLARGIPEDQHCFKALGYREVIRHLRGELSFADLVERVTILTHQFAKRQMVWLRAERPAIWLAPEGGGDAAGIEGMLENLLEMIRTPPV